ncbi:class I SAM-dependent methyltransferase, partial [Nonomuraea rubra]|uniref:class I SAM-dependent DNA methyltransferase n=1 Tax=Nonomuraea rubra TaxID=46180 RepID=UPI0031ED7B48
MRAEVFDREAATLPLHLPDARVLDIGSGTGFYVRRWQGLGVKSIVGCDLTAAAVERLRGRFPGVEFHELDIAEPGDTLERGAFDAVSAMDMLFHITDDARYRAALGSVAAALRPGGIFVLSENFLQRPEQRGDHQVNHTLPWITRALDEAGFDVMRRMPMLVLMNAQVDAGPVLAQAVGRSPARGHPERVDGRPGGIAALPAGAAARPRAEGEPHHGDDDLPPPLTSGVEVHDDGQPDEVHERHGDQQRHEHELRRPVLEVLALLQRRQLGLTLGDALLQR